MTWHLILAAATAAALIAWATAHQIVLYYVVSVLIERLPPPDVASGKFYTYVYSVAQVFVANTKRAQDAVSKPKP